VALSLERVPFLKRIIWSDYANARIECLHRAIGGKEKKVSLSSTNRVPIRLPRFRLIIVYVWKERKEESKLRFLVRVFLTQYSPKLR
jgi:hypothetical protein